MKYSSLPVEQLQLWCHMNGVKLNGARFEPHIMSGGVDKGGGILATQEHESEAVLLTVPHDLVLSKERVEQNAKADKYLAQVLEALGDFVQTPRKAILVFLLMQMTQSSPEFEDSRLGLPTSHTDYFKFLPKDIPLPTSYSEQEREMLIGTSLADALDQKFSSLQREFQQLRELTEPLEWARKAWWDEDDGRLEFRDWLLVDAMYRSRALELPQGIGDAMVPVVDMANHAADEKRNARFEVDHDGNVLLMVREGRSIRENEEITIIYGAGGACEMVFSYGFLEASATHAREMLLSLQIPMDDPLRMPKLHYSKNAPGVRIYTDKQGQYKWESDIVWWACVNEEDGLSFEVLQTNDGERQLQATWNETSLGPDELKTKLMQDSRKELFELRATVMIQERVELQGEELSAGQEGFEAAGVVAEERQFIYDTIKHLRALELDLLSASFEALDNEKAQLLGSRTVSEYLSGTSTVRQTEGQEEEDFS